MENKERKNPVDEHINKIKHRMGYSINESPKYKPLIGDEFDQLPTVIHATQDGQPMPNTSGTDAYLEEQSPEEDNPAELPGAPELAPKEPVAEPSNAEEPDTVDADELPEEDPTKKPVETDVEVSAEETVEEPEEGVDEIQNEIIRHNIEAMKGLTSKLEDFERINSELNQKLAVLNAKVEEVEEPTDAEKLMSKKDVSYPYYFNLNDYWKGNFFEQNREKNGEKGIRELPDGTYIADFDDLPTHSGMDVKDSFNSIV
jgi:hypothetical protein